MSETSLKDMSAEDRFKRIIDRANKEGKTISTSIYGIDMKIRPGTSLDDAYNTYWAAFDRKHADKQNAEKKEPSQVKNNDNILDGFIIQAIEEIRVLNPNYTSEQFIDFIRAKIDALPSHNPEVEKLNRDINNVLTKDAPKKRGGLKASQEDRILQEKIQKSSFAKRYGITVEDMKSSALVSAFWGKMHEAGKTTRGGLDGLKNIVDNIRATVTAPEPVLAEELSHAKMTVVTYEIGERLKVKGKEVGPKEVLLEDAIKYTIALAKKKDEAVYLKYGEYGLNIRGTDKVEDVKREISNRAEASKSYMRKFYEKASFFALKTTYQTLDYARQKMGGLKKFFQDSKVFSIGKGPEGKPSPWVGAGLAAVALGVVAVIANRYGVGHEMAFKITPPNQETLQHLAQVHALDTAGQHLANAAPLPPPPKPPVPPEIIGGHHAGNAVTAALDAKIAALPPSQDPLVVAQASHPMGHETARTVAGTTHVMTEASNDAMVTPDHPSVHIGGVKNGGIETVDGSSIVQHITDTVDGAVKTVKETFNNSVASHADKVTYGGSDGQGVTVMNYGGDNSHHVQAATQAQAIQVEKLPPLDVHHEIMQIPHDAINHLTSGFKHKTILDLTNGNALVIHHGKHGEAMITMVNQIADSHGNMTPHIQETIHLKPGQNVGDEVMKIYQQNGMETADYQALKTMTEHHQAMHQAAAHHIVKHPHAGETHHAPQTISNSAADGEIAKNAQIAQANLDAAQHALANPSGDIISMSVSNSPVMGVHGTYTPSQEFINRTGEEFAKKFAAFCNTNYGQQHEVVGQLTRGDTVYTMTNAGGGLGMEQVRQPDGSLLTTGLDKNGILTEVKNGMARVISEKGVEAEFPHKATI